MSKDTKPCAVVLGGRSGLLGTTLALTLEQADWTVHVLGRQDLDMLDTDALARHLDSLEPAHVFNCVAYTKVDQAEDEQDQACLLNRTLPTSLGRLSQNMGFSLIHFSTDFVFDGKRRDHPYEPQDKTAPMSVYGRSKLAGEQALLEISPAGLLIVRTAWLFGPGKGNFVATMLKLAKERDQIGVVHDQIGSPTYTKDLARHTLDLIAHQGQGIHHVVNSGSASWCELAAESIQLAGLHCTVNAIASADYPQKALRPAYSVLSTESFTALTGVTPRPWAQALQDYVYQDWAEDPENMVEP